nr:MAG TPA: hypothetical protein [Caudoviricetes sp.]
MKRKLVKFLIIGLSLTLMITTWNTYKKYTNKQKNKVQAIQNVNNMTELAEDEIITKLNKEHSLNVLSGSVTLRVSYDNQDNFDDDVLGNIWGKLKLRHYESTNTYSFMFAYNLNELPVAIKEGVPYIDISNNRLNLVKFELVSIDVDSSTGIFADIFSPNEINTLNERIKKIAKNDIQSNNELRSQAMVNLQDDIRELIGNNVIFNINEFDVVERNEFKIMEVKK